MKAHKRRQTIKYFLSFDINMKQVNRVNIKLVPLISQPANYQEDDVLVLTYEKTKNA